MADPELRRELREAVVGAPLYNVSELMAVTGTPREFADELWLSLGFPLLVDDAAVNYSEGDAEALRNLNELIALELAEREKLLAMTRVMGQSMSRIAAAQVQLFADGLVAMVNHDDDGLVDDEVRAAIIDLMVPGVERFVSYCYRRHLSAALDREIDKSDDQGLGVIGFVDLVDFTRTTRKLDDGELADLVGRFERHVYETITNSGARLRKLLGDGVMFDAPDATQAATAALALVMRCAEDPRMAGARGGLALGPILEMEGDIYGETVNRASRLAGLAYPNTVVADRSVGESVQGVAGLSVRPLGLRPVKGLGRVDVVVIRPALV